MRRLIYISMASVYQRMLFTDYMLRSHTSNGGDGADLNLSLKILYSDKLLITFSHVKTNLPIVLFPQFL